MKKIYLSGPMRGFKSCNFRAFDYAAKKLRALGYEVFSPADNDRRIVGWAMDYVPTDEEIQKASDDGLLTTRRCFADDTAYISNEADTVAVIQNWEKSSGVAAEVSLGKAIGLSILYLGEEYRYGG
jgi:hypothetical protein